MKISTGGVSVLYPVVFLLPLENKKRKTVQFSKIKTCSVCLLSPVPPHPWRSKTNQSKHKALQLPSSNPS